MSDKQICNDCGKLKESYGVGLHENNPCTFLCKKCYDSSCSPEAVIRVREMIEKLMHATMTESKEKG